MIQNLKMFGIIYSMDVDLTETGLIAIIGMLFGFLIGCCKQIESSRCERINLCGMECDRTPLKDETILDIEKNQPQKEE